MTSPRTIITALLTTAFSMMLVGCTTTAPKDQSSKQQLHAEVRTALDSFTNKDSSLQNRLDKAAGYAVFPKVGKGGLIVGGAFGRGEVFEGDRRVGYATMTAGTIGAQIGGQSFSQLILFETQKRLDAFKAEEFSFSAQASAVAATAGAAREANYRNGVLVFINDPAGLMAEASVGGQKFDFVPAE
jgi:lipid-binding SYLF domain-containing protein